MSHLSVGTGLHEKPANTGEKVPKLFGAGGHQDGVTALIRTNENTRIEEDMAMTGMGERVIDENVIPNNVENLNTEFNFTAMKTGAARTADGRLVGTQNMARMTDGLAAGDVNVHTDENYHTQDQVLGALTEVYGQMHHSDEPQSIMAAAGNPFASFVSKETPFSGAIAMPKNMDHDLNVEHVDVQTDLQVSKDIQNEGVAQESVDFYLGSESVDHVEPVHDIYNHNTGLRRRNTKVSQSKQLQRVGQKDDIMNAIEQSAEMHANIMQEQFKAAFRTEEDKAKIFEQLHTDTNRYTASQVGVHDISESSYRNQKSRRGANKGEMMRSMLIGV